MKAAFTLVELLIVVSIIGILAAIAIPQFTKYKKNAAYAQAEGGLSACAAFLGAEYAVNGLRNHSCLIDSKANQACGLQVEDTGEMTLANCSISIKGISVKCNATVTNSSIAFTCFDGS